MGTESPVRKFDGTVAMGAAISIVAQAKAFVEVHYKLQKG